MKRLSDRFAESAASCSDLPNLRALLGDAVSELGFHYFALVDHPGPTGAATSSLRIDNYPEAWVHEVLTRGYAIDDPVHLASRRSNMGFGWSELGTVVRLDRRHRRILSRGRFHGLSDGFTVPANVPNEPSASCSFAVRAGRDFPARSRDCLELIGAHALRAARRLRSWTAPPPRPRLSRREVQCLRLVAMGKTDWEIAAILGLAPETVRQYMKRARAAYDAVSRAQLVAYGLRDAWIGFEDAIPPNG